MSASFVGARLGGESVSSVGLCQQLWHKRRILPLIVAQILTNRDIELCKAFAINGRTFAYSDILQYGWGCSAFLTGENCFLDFRQLGQ